MKFLCLLICICMLIGCSAHTAEPTIAETVPVKNTLPPETFPPEPKPADPIHELIGDLSLEERVGQLFLARCQDTTAIEDIQRYHLGGFVLFGADFRGQTKESMATKIRGYQDAAKIPLLIAVDEEGGTVNRISSFPSFRETPFAAPRELYASGGLDWVLAETAEKCDLLRSLGINVNLGPVCDITTDRSAFMYRRSLGLEPFETGEVISAMVESMAHHQMGSMLKHFPGYGNNVDTHIGIARDSRTLEELEKRDLIPFSAGFQAGADGVMVSHTIVEAMDSQLPASLSPAVHRYIRDTMGYEGIILTDDLAMEAVTDVYGAGEAAVMAVLSGNDLLCSTEYGLQYEAVLAAVLDGRIDIDTLNAAVYRVLQWKTQLGLL